MEIFGKGFDALVSKSMIEKRKADGLISHWLFLAFAYCSLKRGYGINKRYQMCNSSDGIFFRIKN